MVRSATNVIVTLPAVRLPDTSVATDVGRIVIPGQTLAARQIEIDPVLLQQLLAAARGAARHAYAPYSRFHVGAALIMADDPQQHIFTGVNVENSSFGVTNCAERSGLFGAAGSGFRRLRWLAVSTADALDRPLAERSPCGVCRQAIKEFCGRGGDASAALVAIDNGDPDTLCELFDIDRLLPYGFNFAPG